MENNKEQQAFPCINPAYDGNWNKDPTRNGLTKLEYFSAKVMQGLMSNVDSEKYSLGNGTKTDTAENKAKFCVIIADELLKQLAIHTGGQPL